ncbi:MAG: hypothetical protein J6N45_09725 [Alphaproteobacteria bacterium]|nr:hypothetical protein [Alphaproteobacteria bacterium]
MIYIIHTHGYAMKIVEFATIEAADLYIERVNPIQYVIIRGEYVGGAL